MYTSLMLDKIELSDLELGAIAAGDTVGTASLAGGAGAVAVGGGAIAAGNGAAATIGVAAAGEIIAAGALMVGAGLIMISFGAGWYLGQGINSLIYG